MEHRRSCTNVALIAVYHTRFRPIQMTTIAVVIGMLPIALASGDGADLNRGLAMVIIGGLPSSLFLTLVIIQVVYSIFDGIRRRRNAREEVNYEQLMVGGMR